MKFPLLFLGLSGVSVFAVTSSHIARDPENYAARSRSLFFDFDGTIAANETILIFAEAVYASTPSSEVTLPPLPKFLAEYETNITKARQAYGTILTVRDEVEFESSALRRDVDVTLYNRVKASGMIGFLTQDALEKAAESVVLREGWWEFASRAIERDETPVILSDNFSVQWIRLILRTSWRKHQGQHPRGAHLDWGVADEISIYCSEIIAKPLFRPCPNNHIAALHSGGDKARLILRLTDGDTRDALYAGNGLEDVPPIEASGVGILLGASNDIKKQLVQEGATLKPLNTQPQTWRTQKRGVIYEAADFRPLLEKFNG